MFKYVGIWKSNNEIVGIRNGTFDRIVSATCDFVCGAIVSLSQQRWLLVEDVRRNVSPFWIAVSFISDCDPTHLAIQTKNGKFVQFYFIFA